MSNVGRTKLEDWRGIDPVVTSGIYLDPRSATQSGVKKVKNKEKRLHLNQKKIKFIVCRSRAEILQYESH
jgi:hypothetical protein